MAKMNILAVGAIICGALALWSCAERINNCSDREGKITLEELVKRLNIEPLKEARFGLKTCDGREYSLVEILDAIDKRK